MTYEFIEYDVADGIAVLTFNRPRVLNAHHFAMKEEIEDAANRAADDDGVQALVVTGAGRGFHAGEDVKGVFLGGGVEEMREARRASALGILGTGAWNGHIHPQYFYEYPKATIAAVNGPAVGGGLAIALSCDLRIGSQNASFGYVFGARGLMGPSRGLATLVGLVGPARTLEMALTAELVPADEAERLGLVSKVVPQDQLLDDARDLARRTFRTAPLAQRAIKRSMASTLYRGELLEEWNARLEEALMTTDDHQEGVAAFAERRPARWASR